MVLMVRLMRKIANERVHTLSRIAGQSCKDTAAGQRIDDANRSLLSVPNLIYLGQRLKIPLTS